MEAALTKLVFALSIGFQVAILVILIARRLKRRFLWFVVYITYELIATALRLSVAANKRLYFNVYWLTAIGGVLLSLMAVWESFLNVFWIYTRYRWFTRVVWIIVGLAVIYSAYRAWAFPPVHASWLVSLILDLELGVNYCFTAVGLLYFLFVRFEKIKEHQWESAVISGFTTIGALSIIAVLIRSVFGVRFEVLSRWVEPVAFILAEIEWAVVFSRPERVVPEWVRKREVTTDDLTRLDQYAKVLERILGRK
jgi:hypothetical protein